MRYLLSQEEFDEYKRVTDELKELGIPSGASITSIGWEWRNRALRAEDELTRLGKVSGAPDKLRTATEVRQQVIDHFREVLGNHFQEPSTAPDNETEWEARKRSGAPPFDTPLPFEPPLAVDQRMSCAEFAANAFESLADDVPQWWCPHVGGFGPPFTCAVCRGATDRGETVVPIMSRGQATRLGLALLEREEEVFHGRGLSNPFRELPPKAPQALDPHDLLEHPIDKWVRPVMERQVDEWVADVDRAVDTLINGQPSLPITEGDPAGSMCQTCRMRFPPEAISPDVAAEAGELWHIPCADHNAIVAKVKLNASVGFLPGRIVLADSITEELATTKYDGYTGGD